MVANKRIQQSIMVARDPRFEIFKNMERPQGIEWENEEEFTIVMPLTWVNESFTITEDLEKSVAYRGYELKVPPNVIISAF